MSSVADYTLFSRAPYPYGISVLKFQRDIPVNCLIELTHNDPVISAHCIAAADRSLGRSRYDEEEKNDRDWWKAHNAAMAKLFDAATMSLSGPEQEMKK